MEAIFVTNGETKLVLIPERETERILLDELMQRGDVIAHFVRGPVDILGKPAQGGVVLKAEGEKANDTSET